MLNWKSIKNSRIFIILIFSTYFFYLIKRDLNIIILLFFADNRQRGRFAGFSLYVSMTGDIQGSTLCYKDGPELPPLNFTTTCVEQGRYVIFYNERKDSDTYPNNYQLTTVFNELCEVWVLGIVVIYLILWYYYLFFCISLQSIFCLFLKSLVYY